MYLVSYITIQSFEACRSIPVFQQDCHGNKKKVLSYVGDKGDAWRESCTKVHSQPNDFNLLIEGVRGDGYLGDIAIDDIELSADVSCSCRAADDPCDFEKDTCSWVQDTTDNFDWTLNSGSTPSLDTGPNGDHTTGTGHYLFVEGSSPQRSGYQAKLLSPVLNPGQQYCLDYWYNMNGANMGTLDVYTQVSTSTV
ncbi:MAM domain-containing protein 2-like [Argopecten irradians]|uniref:MAM domain-containing protein 2-like n=1 Tax=Argopecten irradians TaxID=31199 RepID=UPI003713CBF0